MSKEMKEQALDCGHSNRFIGAFGRKDGVCLVCALEQVEKEREFFRQQLAELQKSIDHRLKELK